MWSFARLARLTAIAVALLVGATALSFLGRLHWALELLTHFRVQMAAATALVAFLAGCLRLPAVSGLAALCLVAHAVPLVPYLEAGATNQNQLDFSDVNANGGAYARHDYKLTFPAAGTYSLWIRAWGDNSDQNTIFIGLDGVAIGSIGEDVFGQWVWDNLIQDGTNQITIGSPGAHTISIWRRETGHRLDAIYFTKGGAVPSGGIPSGASVINPSRCSW